MAGSRHEEPSGAPSHRTQIAVAVVTGAAVVLAALVTGGFGLLSGGTAEPNGRGKGVSATGGGGRNDGACVSDGVVVEGTVHCAPPRDDGDSPTSAGSANDLVHITVVNEPMDDDVWIAPASTTRGERPPPQGNCGQADIDARASWFANRGGAPAGFEIFRVDVVNDSDRTMVIEGLKVANIEVLPPIRGPGATLCEGQGGPFDIQYVLIDLDQRPPNVEYFNADFEHVSAVDFAPEPHEPLRFFIQANAARYRYRWNVVLEYSLDGKHYAKLLRDGEQPFEVSGYSIPAGTCGI